jgi:hypothetical protein
MTLCIMVVDISKSDNISHINNIKRVAKQAPMCVHDVAGKSAVYYLHHEGAWVAAKRLHEENRTAPLISRIWVVKGTLSRDFLTLVFFIIQFLLVRVDMPRKDFEFFRIFEELFVFVFRVSRLPVVFITRES